jgi:hypothetical protein
MSIAGNSLSFWLSNSISSHILILSDISEVHKFPTGRCCYRNENKKIPPDIFRTLEDYPVKGTAVVVDGMTRRVGETDREIDCGKKTPSINKQNSPSEHNNRETCASYQSINAQDPPRLACEWNCFDKARCSLNHIYRISVARVLDAEYCLPVLDDIRRSLTDLAIVIR